MKLQAIVGILALSSVISIGAHAGPTAGPRPIKEVVRDYMQKMDEYRTSYRNGKIKPSALDSVEALKSQEQTMDDLGLNRGEKSSIKSLIASGRAQKIDVITSLNVLSAAKKGTQGKTDAESLSISKYTDTATKYMANAELIGEKKSSSFLSASEFKEVSEAARKLIEIIDRPTAYEMNERDSYTASMNRAVELAPKVETFEEGLVKGIMETAKDSSGKTGITKEAAMEIIRKITRCTKAV